MNLSLALHDSDGPVAVTVIGAKPQRFITINVGGFSIYLPDYETLNAAAARALARELTHAADIIEADLAEVTA